MKKRIVTAAAFAACLALCAAVWPQNEPIEETPEVPSPPAVTAAQPEVPEMTEIEESIISEKETVDVAELAQAETAAPAPEPIQTSTPPEKGKTAEPKQEPEVAPASPNTAPDNMVYVPGFGWLKSQGPNHAEYAEDMYENGNKIGIMG